MIEKYLPIGTVVILKEGKKKLMITGFCMQIEEDKKTVYDYCGCLYPEGIITYKNAIVFNHEQIDKVYSIGYINEEEKAFKIALNEALEKENKEGSQDTSDSSVDIPKPIETLNSDDGVNSSNIESNPDIFNI